MLLLVPCFSSNKDNMVPVLLKEKYNINIFVEKMLFALFCVFSLSHLIALVINFRIFVFVIINNHVCDCESACPRYIIQ